MAGTRNNSQAGKTKRKSVRRLRQWLDKSDLWLIFGITILIAISFIIFVIVMFSCSVPEWVSYLLGDDGKRGTLTFIGFGIGGLALWHRAVSAGQQAKAMAGATKQAEAGHTQERLKTSIEHLGKKNASVRIGAAYELYHLAKDRDNYQETVCDILCNHIRQKTQEKNYKKEQKDEPSEEIKIFLKLLCGEECPFRECQIDLSSSFLQGANLSETQLQEAWLMKAQLQGADLSEAQLQGADLSEAQLQEAWLEAQLQGANLSGAQLQGAWLSEAQLQGASLSETQLQEAWLMKAQLQEAGLSGAQLQGADLSGAQLQGAWLSEAQLQGAWLSGAQLQGADLSEAQLQGAWLSGAQLQGADLSGAQLQGAWLSEAQLQGADLSEAQLQRAWLMKAQLQGANLWGVQLQGASLLDAKLQGVSSSEELSEMSFQDRIRARIGEEPDFTNVVFRGGLNADHVKEIIASMPAGMEDERKEEMENKLNEHVGEKASGTLPDNSGAITGVYSKDKAKEWITDYEKSTNLQFTKDKQKKE